MGYKSDGYWAVFGCSSCHDIIDGRLPYDCWPGELEETNLQGLPGTYRQRLENGGCVSKTDIDDIRRGCCLIHIPTEGKHESKPVRNVG
nr:DUF1364 domain-containing protein [Serratia sp. PL7]